MATKTDMVNLAILKLMGSTSGATQIIESAIAAGVFADPSTASGENATDQLLYCTRYEFCLKKALRDIRPKFARKFADLGLQVEITQDNSNLVERAGWSYCFQLPADYLDLMWQIDEAVDYDINMPPIPSRIVMVDGWSHVVGGDDGNSYYCSTSHTSVDNASDGQPTDDDGDGNWTQFSSDDDDGATWEAGKAYLNDTSSFLLLTNDLSNADGDSAYIEYIGYLQGGFADDPNYYDDNFIEAFTSLLAAEMAPWAASPQARSPLLKEYLYYVQRSKADNARPDYEEVETSWLDARY